MVRGINVQDAPPFVGLRFRSRGDGDALLRLAADAIRIAEREFAFVAGCRLQIQDAAGKAFGHRIGHLVLVAVHAFAADAQQRQRRTPVSGPCLAEAYLDGGVSVSVPRYGPFESEVEQRRVFYMELTRLSGILGREGAGGEDKQGKDAHGERILRDRIRMS